jgi:signal transduction histidine kinase/DNA-binding response OmpR family regulator
MLRLSLRAKLMAIVTINAVGLLIIIVASSALSATVADHLQDIRQQYLPKVGLRAQLVGQFERLQRGIQDATAANDRDALAATHKQKDALMADVDDAHSAIDPGDVAALHHAVDDYYAAAHDVAKRLIAGETGEGLNITMQAMQGKQSHVAELVEKVSAIDKREMSAAFTSAAQAQEVAANIRLGISALCLFLVLLVSAWIGRGVLRNIGYLTAGFTRFGHGNFSEPVPTGSADELGDVAVLANQMAARLQQMGKERERVDWLTAGETGLAEQLLVEMEPQEVADRSLKFLARYVEAPVAVMYYLDSKGEFKLVARYGLDDGPENGALDGFKLGVGLLGETARQNNLVVVSAPPEAQLRLRSGLVDGVATSVVLVPLVHSAKVVGLLEFAVLQPWQERASELLASVRDRVAGRMEVARSRAATHTLLAETQAQAQRLAAQEEELRKTNEDLASKASELQVKSDALEQRNADLTEARIGLQQRAEELQAASSFKSQFLANMSHELRTPLNAVIGFAELLHSGDVKPNAPEHQEFLGEILDSGRHLLRLINDILDLSKVEAGKIELRPENVDIAKLAGQAATAMSSAAQAKNMRLEVVVAPEIKTMRTDPGRLTQVLYNYLSNAVKFSPKGSVVQLRIAPEGTDAVRFEVVDHGVGIAPEDLAKLFSPFVQLMEGAAKEYQGTGLGLALTKRMVERLGGTVGVTSQKGEGSTFWAILPVDVASADTGAVTLAPTPTTAVPAHPNGLTVLVVEDNPHDQELIMKTLAEQGFAVQIGATVALAVEAARARHFDAITLDLLLPDGSGLDVLRKIREGGPNQNSPVIVVSVSRQEGLVHGYGLTDYLVKPVDPAVLRHALERAITPHTGRDVVMVIDDDPSALRLMEAVVAQIGYHAAVYLDAEQALRDCHRTDLAAVVLDLIMPGMSGFGFVDALQVNGPHPPVPVIIWTNKDVSRAELDKLRQSVSAVIRKSDGGGVSLTERLRRYLPERAKEAESKPTGEAASKPTGEAAAKPTAEAETKPVEAASKPTGEAESKPTAEAEPKPTGEAEPKPIAA